VTIIDADTGAPKGTAVVGAGAAGLTIVERTGRAFVLNAVDDSVSVLDARDGTALRTVRVGAFPVADAVDARDRQVWVANQAGNTVSILDAHTGADLATVPVGVAPSAIVVDGAIGRAYVLNGGGVAQQADIWSWAPGWLRRWLPPATLRLIPATLSVLRTVGAGG
jgi:YVTN family beta-propeller protein